MGKISPEFWQRMVDDMGLEEATAFVRQDGNEPPDGYDAQTPTLGAPASEEPIGAETVGGEDEGGLSVMQIHRDALKHQQDVAAMRKQRFDEAAAQLAKERAGPPLSERLFALSAAMLKPTSPYQSQFTGLMGNILPTLVQEGQDVRKGKAIDAAAMRALHDKYMEGSISDEDKAISTKLALARLIDSRNKAKAAEAKANQPTVQLDAQGNKRIVPKYAGLHRPKSEAELAAVPLGEDFVVWEGPQAGEIMTKLAP